jgi:hypothetical protein
MKRLSYRQSHILLIFAGFIICAKQLLGWPSGRSDSDLISISAKIDCDSSIREWLWKFGTFLVVSLLVSYYFWLFPLHVSTMAGVCHRAASKQGLYFYVTAILLVERLFRNVNLRKYWGAVA